MPAIDPGRIAVYIRWSTEDQGLGHTLAIQSDACRHYCLSQGWQLQDRFIYVDEGWSGGTLKRPALDRLRADVENGFISVVVVYKLDRLSRNIKDIIALVLDEWDSQCAVRSTMEPIDTASDTGKLTFTLLSSFADFERGTIRARTLGGKRKNAEQGRNAGVPYPFGYERGDQAGTYRIVESEAAVVRLVFDLYLQGMGCKPLAEHLNRLGILNRKDGPGRPRLNPGLWSNTAVLRILKNTTYTGRMVYSRRSRNPRKGKVGEPWYLTNEPSSVIQVESPYIPAIIDLKTFEQAERIRKSKLNPSFGKRVANSPHLLSGMVWCHCGHSMVGRKSSAKSAKYYWCSGRKNKGTRICSGGMIRAELMDDYVLDRLERVYGLATAEITPEWRGESDRQRQTQQQLMRLADAALDKNHQAKKRLVTDYRAGIIGGQAYQHLYEELALEEERLQSAIKHYQAELTQMDDTAKQFQERAESYITLCENFDTLTDAHKKLVLQHLVHRITAFKAQGTDDLTIKIDYTGMP